MVGHSGGGRAPAASLTLVFLATFLLASTTRAVRDEAARTGAALKAARLCTQQSKDRGQSAAEALHPRLVPKLKT